MGLVRDLFTTGRLHGSGNLIGPFIAVAILIRMPWTLWPLLGIAGSLTYVAGCAHNSVVDRFRDANDPLRTQLPLVIGRVSPRQVLAFAVVTELIAACIVIGVSWFRHPGSFLVPALIGISALLSYVYNEYGKTSSRWVALLTFDAATVIPIVAVGLSWTGQMTPLLWYLGLCFAAGLAFVTMSGDAKDADISEEQNLVKNCGGRLDGTRFYPGNYKWALNGNAALCGIVFTLSAYEVGGWWWGMVVATLCIGFYSWVDYNLLRPTFDKVRFTYCAAVGTMTSLVGAFIVFVPLFYPLGLLWTVPVLVFGPIALHLLLLKLGIGREWRNSVLTFRTPEEHH